MPVYRFENLPTVQQNPNLSSNRGESIKGERMYFCHRKGVPKERAPSRTITPASSSSMS